ncbi:MAG: DUF1444 family protein [Candidatus Melainabacteria bacterium]|nr:DUF1444 family protein [Candidatus Melainabacteria bacterium]
MRSASLFAATLFLLSSATTGVQNAHAQPKMVDDRETFSQHVMQIATQEFPNLNLKKTDKPLQCTWVNGNHLSLDNLYKTIRQDTEPGKEDEEIRRFLKSITELSTTGSAKNIPAWDDVKAKLRPQIVPATKVKVNPSTSADSARRQPSKKIPVHRPLTFSTKLYEGFVIDSENTFQYVYQEHLQKWNVTLDAVSKCAYDNLSKNSQNLKLELNDDGLKDPKSKYITISVPDGYAAARLLLPEIRKRLQKDLGDKCYVGIPNRDYLIAWSPEAPHQERFAEQVRKRFQRRHHPLTPQVYQLDDNTLSNAVIIADEPEPAPRPKRRKLHRIIRKKVDPATATPGTAPATTQTTAPGAASPPPAVSPPNSVPEPSSSSDE